jgi:hypothetical protein
MPANSVGIAAAKKDGRPRLVPRESKCRSRVSNGADLLPNIDGRSAIARRFRDIIAAVAVDQGGADHLSEARLQLVRRFAAAAVIAEQMESRLANGQEINIVEHSQLSSTLVRIAQRIGIDRKLRHVVPSLTEYLEYDKDSEAVP